MSDRRLTPRAHKLVCDGVRSEMTIPEYVTGNYAQNLYETGNTGNFYPEGGYEGTCMFPARLDHSHPLNVMSTGDRASGKQNSDYVKPIGNTALFGSSKFYARVDHVHTLPTGATGATGIGGNVPLPGPPVEFKVTEEMMIQQSVERGSWTRNGSTGNVGFKLMVCCGETTYNGYNTLMFREMTVDALGTIVGVSAAKYGGIVNFM